MTIGRHSLLLLLGLVMLLSQTATAGQDVIGVRAATEAPAGARYTGIIVNWRVKTLEIKLDRFNGRTWLYDRHIDGMVSIPWETNQDTGDDGRPHYQIIANNEFLMLMNTTTGDTWRYDRRPNEGTAGFAWAGTATGPDIVGWHRVR